MITRNNNEIDLDKMNLHEMSYIVCSFSISIILRKKFDSAYQMKLREKNTDYLIVLNQTTVEINGNASSDKWYKSLSFVTLLIL